MPNENAISVRNLTKKYSDFKLNNISFDVPKGKIVVLLAKMVLVKQQLLN